MLRYKRCNGPNANTPVSGTMQFDKVDFGNMTKNDAELVILHEMGHARRRREKAPARVEEPAQVLGLVNIGLRDCGTCAAPFHYTCPKAKAEYRPCGTHIRRRAPRASARYEDLMATYESTLRKPPRQPLRIEDGGGNGTKCSHWEEDSFDAGAGVDSFASELMTGRVAASRVPRF